MPGRCRSRTAVPTQHPRHGVRFDVGASPGPPRDLDGSLDRLDLGVHRLVALEGFIEGAGDPHDVTAVAHGGPEEVDPAPIVRLELPGLDCARTRGAEDGVEQRHHPVERLNEVAMAEDHRPPPRVTDQTEVRVALFDRDRLGRVAALGEDLDEAVPHRYPVVRRQQMRGVAIAGAGGGRGILLQQPQVAVVGGTGPEVVVVIPRDEPQRRRDGGVMLPGTHGPDELGERRGGVFRRGEGQFEQVPQHNQLRGILPRLSQRAEAVAQRSQHRRGGRGVDTLAVRAHVRQQAVQRAQMKVRDADPANSGHEDPRRWLYSDRVVSAAFVALASAVAGDTPAVYMDSSASRTSIRRSS